MIERRRFRGCGVGLGCLGFAGGLGLLVRGSAASLGDFDLGVKLTLGFHLNGDGDCSHFGIHLSVRFGGLGPGGGARIPRAVLTGEAGPVVGCGGCGCPGPGLGHAESLSGVPRVYDPSRFSSDVKTSIVYQKPSKFIKNIPKSHLNCLKLDLNFTKM